jgi:hypothetical protein
MKNFLYLALLIMVATSCTHKTSVLSTSADYMIIGPGGGFRPPVGTYYYLSPTQLLADTTVYLPAPPTTLSGFSFNTTMPPAKFTAMGSILNEIPSSVLPLNHTEIGVSRVAVDGGYTVVRAKIGSTIYDWKFHDDQSTSSTEIQTFVTKVQKVFE